MSNKVSIPENLYKDRYWMPVIFLFSKHPKLSGCFTTKYFDFQKVQIKVRSLKRDAAPWSDGEKFMLNLALHLYNPLNKVDLSGMDRLDYENKELAIEAIQIRYG